MQTVREVVNRRLENYLGCFTSDRPREYERYSVPLNSNSLPKKGDVDKLPPRFPVDLSS